MQPAPGRENIQTFFIDPLSGIETRFCIRLAHDNSNDVSPALEHLMYIQTPEEKKFNPSYPCFSNTSEMFYWWTLVTICVFVFAECACVNAGEYGGRTGWDFWGKEGHSITYPHSLIEYDIQCVMLKSVRSPYSHSTLCVSCLKFLFDSSLGRRVKSLIHRNTFHVLWCWGNPLPHPSSEVM